MVNTSTTKVQNGIKDINQEFKERDIQENAKKLGLPYVNLINIPLNSDLASFLSKEDSEKASAVLFMKSGKDLKLAVSHPDKTEIISLIKRLKSDGYSVLISLCSDESIKSGQKIYYNNSYKKNNKIENIVEESNLASYVNEINDLEEIKDKIEHSSYDIALNLLQVGGFKSHASDIHFQPEEGHVHVRFRIDGVLKSLFNLSTDIYEGILKQIKQLSSLKLNITNVPQDGQYYFLVNKRKISVRVSVLPSNYGETCVIRLLDSKKTFEGLENMGFEGESLKNLQEVMQLPHGMILVTGPTGSGKTTTMYSMLQLLDVNENKIITLEDPIEYDLYGITQSQVDQDSEYTFSKGLRAILRQDPDVIMLGEIRDLETAETAAQASLTGHLVLSTIHTNSAIESISRLVNMGIKSFILAPAIDLIIAQRLVRTLCPNCSVSRAITDTEKEHIELSIQSMQNKGVQTPVIPTELKHPSECDKCSHTGFIGQIAIAEVLRFNQELRDMILENKSMPDIYAYINQHLKMVTMYEDGVLKVIRGLTTLDEVYRVAA